MEREGEVHDRDERVEVVADARPDEPVGRVADPDSAASPVGEHAERRDAGDDPGGGSLNASEQGLARVARLDVVADVRGSSPERSERSPDRRQIRSRRNDRRRLGEG